MLLRQPARPVGWGRSERGESLIELIIAITIMSIAVVTIVGAIATSIMMSDIHRKQATAGSYIRSYASAIQNAVAIDISGATYGDICSSTLMPNGLSSSAYTASIKSCTVAGNLTTMVLQVASKDARDTEQLQLVVRRPCVAPTVDGQSLDSGCNS